MSFNHAPTFIIYVAVLYDDFDICFDTTPWKQRYFLRRISCSDI